MDIAVMDETTSTADAIAAALRLGAIPSAAMLIMSTLLFVIGDVPKVVVQAMQHLAAGIVLSAVAVELVPIISAAPSEPATIAGIVVGFFAGVALFLTIAKVCPEAEDDDDDDNEDDKASPMMGSSRNSARSRSSRILTTEKTKAKTVMAKIVPPFPFAFTIAVLVDASVDGLLIGLSSAAGASAGFVMALALTIEMGFLAITYGATVIKQPVYISVPCLAAAPAMLMLGACGGAAAAAAVASNVALHTGLISFGIAALLYLVTEELLLEAHESQTEEHVWYVDLCFFAGFMASFLLEKFGG